jgi:D-alanyl-D-alanine carboxypeptidase
MKRQPTMRFLVLAGLASVAVRAAPAVTIPGTPAGQVFSAWLVAANSGDRAQVQAFDDRYHDKTPAQYVVGWHDQFGGFNVLRIEKSSALSLSVLLEGKDIEQAFLLDLSLSAADPAAVESLKIPGVALPPELAPARMTQGAAVVAVQARADELAKQDRFSGAVLIAQRGKILLDRTWGLADRATDEPIKLDTLFRIGSMNKMFTAVAILQLIEAGKVALQNTVGTYLPDYPNRDVAEKVTLRELLNHTGGTGDIFGPQFDAKRTTLKTNADYVKLYGTRGLAHEPGKQDSYSNYGFVLLGEVIERVSGMSYYNYVERHIFKVAGMHSTASPPEALKIPARAIGYMKQDGAWVDDKDKLPYRGMAAGGGCSTVGDLFKFAQALESGKLVSGALLHEATEPQNNGRWYGYGFMVSGGESPRYYGHEGGAPGMNGNLRVFPELGVVIVVLSNLDPPAADRLVDFYSLRMPISP